MELINAPSLANCSLLHMGEEIRQLVEGGADWFHVDIMDGHYVPNLCFPVPFIRELKCAYPEIPVDVHLMVTNPADYVESLAFSGADYISFHIDATSFSRRILTQIRKSGKKAGAVLNPSQPVAMLEPLVNFLDYAVLMTVEPGFAGQQFLPDSIERLRELIKLRDRRTGHFLISIDGGVDTPHAIECARLGVEIYITGNFTVFKQSVNLKEACVQFKKVLYSALKE